MVEPHCGSHARQRSMFQLLGWNAARHSSFSHLGKRWREISDDAAMTPELLRRRADVSNRLRGNHVTQVGDFRANGLLRHRS